MKTKEKFLNLITTKNYKKFPEVLKITNGKFPKSSSELEEWLVELSRPQQRQLWEVVQQFILSSFGKPEMVESSTASIVENLSEKKETDIFVSILFLCTVQVKLISSGNETFIPEELIKVIVCIGNMQKDIIETLQPIAVRLCEMWILKSLTSFEELVPETFLILLGESLQNNAKKLTVKRVWSLRKCFSAFPFSISDNEPLKDLLLCCMKHPTYLSCDEGIKFLASVMQIECLLPQIQDAVKMRLLECSKIESEKYGEVYFRAWKESAGPVKKKIEEDCLQDMMYLAVHLDRISRLTETLFGFLSYIHNQKKHLPTATMIYNLYEPFLWRSFKVASGTVRLNAALILCDAFPLSSLEHSQEEKEEALDLQYQAFITFLTDPSDLVRIETIKGVFKILSKFWLAIPSSTIQKMFQIFLSKLLLDASSAEVRTQVVKGVTLLLDVVDASSFMENVLPHVAESFDDINSNVRIATVKMFLKVKQLQLVKYWELVPLKHLLHTLSEDPPIRSLIIRLLQDNFLPLHSTEKEMLGGCIELVTMNRESSMWFYKESSKIIDLETTCRFILLIWKVISKYASTHSAESPQPSTSKEKPHKIVSSPHPLAVSRSNTRIQQKRKRETGRDKENQDPSDGKFSNCSREEEEERKDGGCSQMPLDNPEVILGLLDTLILLWVSNVDKLSLNENQKYVDALRTRVSSTFPTVWSFFNNHPLIRKTMLYLASYLPSNLVPTLNGLCLSHLRNMEDAWVPEEEFSTYINAICNWNRVDDIVELITEWIEAAFTSTDMGSSSKKKRKKKITWKAKGTANPLLGLRYLSHLFKHPLNNLCLLHKNRKHLLNLYKLTSLVKDPIEKRINTGETLSHLCTDKFLTKCFRLHMVIVTSLHEKPDSNATITDERTRNSSRSKGVHHVTEIESLDCIVDFNDLLNWMKCLLPNGVPSGNKDEFVFKVLHKFFYGCASVIAVGAANAEFIYQNGDYLKEVLMPNAFHINLHRSSIRFVKECFRHLRGYHSLKTAVEHSVQFLPIILKTLPNCKSRIVLKSEEIEKLLRAFECLFSNILSSGQLPPEITDIVVHHVLSCIAQQIYSDPTVLPEIKSFKDLHISSRIPLICLQNARSKDAILKHIQIGLTDNKFDIKEILSILTLLIAIDGNQKRKAKSASWKTTFHCVDEILARLVNLTQSENSSIDSEQLHEEDFIRFSEEKCRELAENIRESL